MNVLLVEDDPALREGLAELLAEVSEVHAAATVGEATRLLSDRPFDLVLADLRIGGDRVGGKKLVEAARRHLVPVVVMSALTLSEIRSQLRQTPPDDVICKPFQVDDVLALVSRFVNRKAELERWAGRRGEVETLRFSEVERGLEVAVAERTPEREVRWYRVAPGVELNGVSDARAHALVVEGFVEGEGMRRGPGCSLHLPMGWPVALRSASGMLSVAVVFSS